MKQLGAFVAGVLVTAAIVLAGPGQAGSGPRAVKAKPECAPGELIMTMTATRGSGGGKAKTAEEALRNEVSKAYPKLSPTALRKGPAGSSTVDFAYERGGKPLASVRVEKAGAGWGVERLTACNSVLTGSKTR